MKITILTLFPEMFADMLKTSVIGRALAKGCAEVELVQIRDFTKDKHRHVDDTPFGGGKGMVMKCQPVLDALNSVRTEGSHVIMMSPAGVKFDQQKAHEYAAMDHLIILCGHYEGMDYRINSHVDELVSIGDYVLTGGELPAMVLVDCLSRFIPGVLGSEESALDESHADGLLEYPQYTRPADFRGMIVPEILQNGHHAKIQKWRHEQALLKTKQMRPILLGHFGKFQK